MILITGGSGMVGSIIRWGVKPNHKELDILKPTSIKKAIKKYKPETILHLAALVDMQYCQDNPNEAYKVNVLGTKNLALACKKNKVKLVYLSTCAVFDGKKRQPYGEKDRTNPINIYGKTKLAGEKVARKILPDVLVIRTGWLFGGGKKDTKFAKKTYAKFTRGENITATFDRCGSPTYVPDLLETVKKLISEDATGIYHVVNSGTASYFDIAKEIKKLKKFKQKVISVKAKSLENPKLKRGKMEALTSSKITLRSWKLALKECIPSF